VAEENKTSITNCCVSVVALTSVLNTRVRQGQPIENDEMEALTAAVLQLAKATTSLSAFVEGMHGPYMMHDRLTSEGALPVLYEEALRELRDGQAESQADP
jgi:hypothetical protein